MSGKTRSNNLEAFLALVQAGLWEQEVRLAPFGKVDYTEVLKLAEEQSVVGLVSAGLEHVTDVRVPKEDILQFVGQALQLEQRNTSMNCFIEKLIGTLRNADVYTLLVKGCTQFFESNGVPYHVFEKWYKKKFTQPVVVN